MNTKQKTQVEQQLFIFVLSLAIPFFLYLNRNLDDNRLTSWKWVFDQVSIYHEGLLLCLVLLFSWLLSLFSFYEKSKAPVLFVLSFCLSSLFWPAPEVIVDSARYFTQAKQLSVYGIGYFAEQWGKGIFAWTDLPLVPFLYGLVFKFLGEQRIFIQILNTLFYSLTVILTYQLGKMLWDEDLGFRAGLLLLGFPYLYTQVPLMLVDVPTMFFFMLAIVATVQALRNGGASRMMLAAFALFFLFYVKYSSWILLTLLPVIYVYYIGINPKTTIKRGLGLALLAALMIGGGLLFYKDMMLSQLDLLLEYQKPGLNRWSESYFSTFFFQIHPCITAGAIAAVLTAARKKDFKFAVISFLILLFLLMQMKRIRYTLPVFPMFALMAAYGIGEIRNGKLRRQLVLSVVSTSFVVAFTGFLPLLQALGVQNLQAAGRYLNTVPGTMAEVVSVAGEKAVVNPATAVPILDIYTDKKLVSVNEPVSPEILARVKTAPLRFTWEYQAPGYYSPAEGAPIPDALVVVSDAPMPMVDRDIKNMIKQYPFHKVFNRTASIFQHQTFVNVYHK